MNADGAQSSEMCQSNSTFDSFNCVSSDEVMKFIMRSPKSSSVVDTVPTRILVDNIDVLLPFITCLINCSLSQGIFPSLFKNACVRPLLKKPSLDRNVLRNYRPVSNLPFLSKVLERVVAQQFQTYMNDNALYSTFQSAYRPFHSCETALVKVQSDILCALDTKCVVIHVMLDLSAAFDTLEHTILINRLSDRFGVKGTPLSWFRSYLSGRSQQVAVGHSMSSRVDLNVGVPQGSVLGPILFNVYTTPLSDVLRSHGLDSHCYADDSQLYIVCKIEDLDSSVSSMNACITQVEQWMTQNRLKLNGDKTELTVFVSPSLPGSFLPLSPLICSNEVIAPQSCCRNLGCLFDSSIAMSAHVKGVCKASYAHLRKLYRIRPCLDLASTESLVHAFISSRLDYCNCLLYGLTQSNLGKLQRIQNAAARLCLRVPRRAHIPSRSLLQQLHWLPVEFRIVFKILLLTFKCLNDQAPSYLSEFLTVRDSAVSLRSFDSHLLVIGPSFFGINPRPWNDLPFSVRTVKSLESFKKSVKTILFRRAFDE